MSEKINVSTLLVFDMANLPDSDEMISEYLTQVLDDGDSDELLTALGTSPRPKAWR